MKDTSNDDNVVKVNLQELAEAANATVDTVHTVDLSNPPGEEVIEGVIEDVIEDVVAPTVEGVVEDVVIEGDDSVLSEIIEDDIVADEIIADEIIADEIIEVDTPTSTLPENIQKLADFINETGGTVEDYVNLNKDIDSLDEAQLLREYHQSLEPSLDPDEISFLMEDLYQTDEDMDEERDIKKKAIAKKRDLSKAKKHLQGLKDKYYDEIKAGSKLNPEQKKAVDFFNRYTSENAENVKTESTRKQVFAQKSEKLFNGEFKGFEFKVGEKKYRYNVKNPSEVKANQSDINNFAKKYLGDDNTLSDAKGYHKALFTAMNPDAIANHFYQQGKADALKTSTANIKNIQMDPRGVHGKVVTKGGITVKTVDSDHSTGKLRIKSRT